MALFVSWLAIALAANAGELPQTHISKEAVIELAKRRSMQDCELPEHRCSFKAEVSKQYDGSMAWNVFVVQAYVQKDGSLSYPIGGDWMFVYNLDGTLRDTFQGL